MAAQAEQLAEADRAPRSSGPATKPPAHGRTLLAVGGAAIVVLVLAFAAVRVAGQIYVDRQPTPTGPPPPQCSAQHPISAAPTKGSADDALAAWLASGSTSARAQPPLIAWHQTNDWMTSPDPTTMQEHAVFRVPENNAARAPISCALLRTNDHGWQVVAVGD
jgi:hypothetical protein